jgi:hypothetical protein
MPPVPPCPCPGAPVPVPRRPRARPASRQRVQIVTDRLETLQPVVTDNRSLPIQAARQIRGLLSGGDADFR